MKTYLLPILLLISGSVLGQSYISRDIKSFGAKGDGKTNDHAAFQRAAAFFNARGGNGKLVISKGTYIVGKQKFNKNTTTKSAFEGEALIHLKNIKNLIIEGDKLTKIRYRAGLKFGSFDPNNGKVSKNGNNFFKYSFAAIIKNAIELTECENISILNLELDGNNQGIELGGIWGDVGRQLPHTGILIENSRVITIDNVYSHHFGLDGMMIMNKSGNSKIKDAIIISNSRFEYNARQGLSWVGGNELTVVKSGFNHTGKAGFASSPGAGVDIEAEVGTISNGKFIDCEFINNTGVGLLADSGPSSDCQFINCLFWGVDSWSSWIRKPRFSFTGCTFRGSIVHGFNAEKDRDATVYSNCLFEDVPYKGKEVHGNFLVESNYAKRLRFENCTFKATKKKIAWIAAAPPVSPEEMYQLINCHFIFNGGIDPADNWVSFTHYIRYKDCTFEMNHPEAKKKNMYFHGIGRPYNVDLGGNKYFINKVKVSL